MSTRRRKRRGQAVNSEPAQKLSRLLASSAGETSGAQPTDLEESGPLDFELAAEETIDQTGQYFWLEATNFFVVQWEENEQHPRVSETAENSPVLQQRDNEEELGNDDGSSPEWPPSPPVWVDDNSQQWEQNEQHPGVSETAGNSPVPPSRDSEEELSDDIYLSPEWPPSPPVWVDDNSHQWEQNEQHPVFSGAAANSPVPPSWDSEEELSNDIYLSPEWPPSPPVWVDDNSQQWEQNEQHPGVSETAANSPVPPSWDSEEELSDDIYTVSSSPYSSDENSQLLEAYEQQRRGLALRRQQQSNSSVLSSDDEDERRANNVCVTATASEQEGSSDKDTSSSKAWQPAIRCPICMDLYSQILQSERLFLVTKCGHVFCSRCLPAAFEVSSACPTCRTELTEEGYHPVYI